MSIDDMARKNQEQAVKELRDEVCKLKRYLHDPISGPVLERYYAEMERQDTLMNTGQEKNSLILILLSLLSTLFVSPFPNIPAPEESKGSGLKYDADKLRLDLIPPEIIQMLGEVFTYGGKKYGEGNWEKGLSEDRLIGAARRHELAFAKGEEIDQDSGLPHLAHAAWNLLIAQTLRERAKLENMTRAAREKMLGIKTRKMGSCVVQDQQEKE